MTAGKEWGGATGGVKASRFFSIAGRLACLLLLALICASQAARAEVAEDEYFKIYSLIQQGDSLSTSGKTAPALAKYREAQAALVVFQKNYRDWNPKLVSFRANDLAAKLSAAAEKETAGAPSNAAPAKATTAGEPPAAAGAAAKVRLLEAGAEPRKRLRLHPKAGDKQTLKLTVKTGVETKVGGMETPAMKLPPMVMNMDMTVKEVAENGDIRYEIVVSDADALEQEGVMQPIVEAMRSALKAAKGMSGECMVTDRGINKSSRSKAPAGGDPQARQAIEQVKDSFGRLTMPFPEEEVGAGARWEIKQTLKSQGITLDQTSVCELTSIEGDVLKVKSTVTQQAANQKIENPAMAGMKLDLNQLTGKGASEAAFDLSRLLVTEGTSDLQTDLSMSMNMGGQQQAMSVKTGMKIQIEGK